MKPLRTRIQEAAKRNKVPQEVIEKDYFLSYTLAGIAAVPEIATALAFKGGTALKKCVFDRWLNKLEATEFDGFSELVAEIKTDIGTRRRTQSEDHKKSSQSIPAE